MRDRLIDFCEIQQTEDNDRIESVLKNQRPTSEDLVLLVRCLIREFQFLSKYYFILIISSANILTSLHVYTPISISIIFTLIFSYLARGGILSSIDKMADLTEELISFENFASAARAKCIADMKTGQVKNLR